LDVAAQVLRGHGIASALLSGGTSTMLAMGTPPDRPMWTVRVRNPYNETEVLDTVGLIDESFSVSGCYGKMLEVDGAPVCNILDPRSGMPLTGALAAVAIAQTGAASDALSTAFLVMGRDAVEAYCRAHPQVAAVFIEV